MQLRPDSQLKTMIKAMTDVVIPAVDAGNQLAMEQAELVVRMMHVMVRQLPLQFQFDQDELARLIGAAQELVELVGAEQGAELAAACANAAAVQARCQSRPDELHQSVRAMRDAICAATDRINASAAADAALIGRFDAVILRMSEQQLLRDRVLLLAQGWELKPDALPPIEALISGDDNTFRSLKDETQ